jgi:hypothetical protein
MSVNAVFVKYQSTSFERTEEAKPVISDRKSHGVARRQVATEGFCVARVPGPGSCCPQYAQFAQAGSTGLSHFEHVGCNKAPQCGQNGNPTFSICPQPEHGFGRGSGE